MPYAVMISPQGHGRERTWEPTDIVFDNGSEAGDYVKRENAFQQMVSSPMRYKAIRITEDNPLAWRQREEKRFEDGTYQRVPWHDYFYNRGFGSTGLYEHIDPDDPTQVRFIASSTDGMEGRYTSMSPGRFIRRYVDDPPSQLMDEWCAKMGLDLTTSPLLLAKTPEEVVRVYNEGPHSCMAYTLDQPVFRHLDHHPVSVYGDSDLAVAYIERRGEITARCLVWPEKKKYSRIYGDSARLVERLKENDYVEDWNLAGARIRQIRNEDGQLILPYIDGDIGVILDGTDWLILSDKPHIIAKSPNGGPLVTACNYCGRSGRWLQEHYEDECDDEPEYICAEGCN